MSSTSAPRRIALLIHALFGGGAEKLMSQLATRWANEYEVHLITWSATSTDAYPIPDNVHRHGLGLLSPSSNFIQGFLANVHRVSRLRQRLRTIEPDLVLSFSDQMNIVALEATKSLECPVWISEHSDPSKQRLGMVWEQWRRRNYPTCTGCVVLTEDIAQWLSKLVDRQKIRIIPPAISYQTPVTLEQESSRSTSNLRRILFVGRLSREKRVDRLLDAWTELHRLLTDWELILVGDGPERSALESLAAQLPRVTFAGWCDSIEEHYRAADLFVLPSEYEGFPVALLEALSHGVSCVATDCTGAIDQLNASGDRDQNCIAKVQQQHCQEELPATIAKLAGDKALRTTMSRAAIQTARQYDWQKVGKLWDAILLPQKTT